MSDVLEKAKQFLGNRQYAYKKTFTGPVAEDVLKDLAVFCFADMTTFTGDRDKSLVAEGRRQTWLRIQNHLNLSPTDLWRLSSGRDD